MKNSKHVSQESGLAGARMERMGLRPDARSVRVAFNIQRSQLSVRNGLIGRCNASDERGVAVTG